MAGERYCDNPEPHEGHEWNRVIDSVDPGWTPGHSSFHYCWGVKESEFIGYLMVNVTRIEAVLERAKTLLREHSVNLRRTAAEFYGGDGTKCELCLDQGADDGPCERCGKEPSS